MSNDRFLFIKAWSYNLWADVNHVLGQLLIAELSNRIPVVYWSTHCLHNGFVQTNGFELYFEPVSRYTVFDIAKPEYTFYPPIWDYDNLLVEDQTKDSGAYRNIGDIMCSNANVVIIDVHFEVYDLIPFIKKNHPAYGMTVDQIYCYLYGKYIKIKPDIDMEVQGYYNSWFKNDRPVLAVHLRRENKDLLLDTTNSNKYEIRKRSLNSKISKDNPPQKPKKEYRMRKKGRPLRPNSCYPDEIQKFIDKYDIKKIFLLTDCEDTLKEYQKRYGSKLLFTDCKRISSEGISSPMENPMIKRRRGVEIIKDTYLASKCDFFIGNDFSNLSHVVTHIKDWSDNNVRLLYWGIGRRKYPVNVELIVRRNRNLRPKRTIERIKKFLEKHKQA